MWPRTLKKKDKVKKNVFPVVDSSSTLLPQRNLSYHWTLLINNVVWQQQWLINKRQHALFFPLSHASVSFVYDIFLLPFVPYSFFLYFLLLFPFTLVFIRSILPLFIINVLFFIDGSYLMFHISVLYLFFYVVHFFFLNLRFYLKPYLILSVSLFHSHF